MKKIAVLFLLMFQMIAVSTDTFGQSIPLNYVREQFSKAVKSEETCNSLYCQMKAAKEKQSAIFSCYYGVVIISLSKFTANPFNKLNYFKTGKKLIEASIAKEPSNVEMRFLRYTVQEHVPEFLNYDQNLAEDKKIILASVDQIAMPKLKKAIVDYMLQSESFTPEEKKMVAALQ